MYNKEFIYMYMYTIQQGQITNESIQFNYKLYLLLIIFDTNIPTFLNTIWVFICH